MLSYPVSHQLCFPNHQKDQVHVKVGISASTHQLFEQVGSNSLALNKQPLCSMKGCSMTGGSSPGGPVPFTNFLRPSMLSMRARPCAPCRPSVKKGLASRGKRIWELSRRCSTFSSVQPVDEQMLSITLTFFQHFDLVQVCYDACSIIGGTAHRLSAAEANIYHTLCL